MGSGLCFAPSIGSDRSPATDEVHNDGDQSEDEQQVNKKAAYVENKKPAEPKQNQNNSQNEKHE
jgi:hypothetical protein